MLLGNFYIAAYLQWCFGGVGFFSFVFFPTSNIFTAQIHSGNTGCLSSLPLMTPTAWLAPQVLLSLHSLHRETVINIEKRPVYISPIKHLWNSHGWGGEKLNWWWGIKTKKWTKKREMEKKRPCKLIQDDSLHPRREGNTGEALCLGHRRTHSLNTVMEWNSKRLSHYKASRFHHSSFLSLYLLPYFL